MFLLYEKEKNTTRTKDFGREIKRRKLRVDFLSKLVHVPLREY